MMTPNEMKREAKEPTLQIPFGGEIWRQPDFPCFSRYIVTSVPGDNGRNMALSTDPREQGNCICSDADGRETFTQAELAEYLHRLGFECEGQLYHLILEEVGPGHIEELKKWEERKGLREWTGK